MTKAPNKWFKKKIEPVISALVVVQRRTSPYVTVSKKVLPILPRGFNVAEWKRYEYLFKSQYESESTLK